MRNTQKNELSKYAWNLKETGRLSYISNTGNLTPMDKYTFRWFRWIHRTNKSSVGETFFRWEIDDVMTHGKQMLVNSDCPMDPSDKRVYYRTNNYPMDI